MSSAAELTVCNDSSICCGENNQSCCIKHHGVFLDANGHISSSSSHAIRIGLGVGLGLGIPLIAVVLGIPLWMYLKERRKRRMLETSMSAFSSKGQLNELHQRPTIQLSEVDIDAGSGGVY
jgi:hypothetical protein